MQPRLDPRIRFWTYVNQRDPEDCWPWTGSKNWRGVGFFNAKATGHKNASAPRVCWEFTVGPIPAGMQVLHHCDNPTCCNPDHLFLGTHADNMADKSAKGRARRGFEHRPRLTPQEVRQAAAMRTAGHTWAQIGRYFDVPYQTVIRRVLKEQAVA